MKLKPLYVSLAHNNPFSDAAVQLAQREGWSGTLVQGSLPGNDAEVFCLLASHHYKINSERTS